MNKEELFSMGYELKVHYESIIDKKLATPILSLQACFTSHNK